MIKAEEARRMRTECRELGVIAPPEFWGASDAFLGECYNGIGPEAWPAWARKLATLILNRHELEAYVHDFEYASARRSFWRFTVANARFAINSCIINIHRYGLTRLAWAFAGTGIVLAVLCQLFGWRGFKETKEEETT
ncbi:MAG: hypothetical protein PHS41_10000 [Victivallaceae bacterium]|nr:hypothetical protein [Victivallaceae bacterium]